MAGAELAFATNEKNSFIAFYEYVSKLEHYGEAGYKLDRINNDGNYEPGNVRWSDAKTQSRNKRNNIFIEYDGQRMIFKEVAEITGIKYGTLLSRHKSGKRGEELFSPVKKN